jgi:hypothetical protein
MKKPNGKVGPHTAYGAGAVYTIEPELVEGCDCEDCREGRHVYSLYELTDAGWEWAAISLKHYTNAEDCKRKHWWGIAFGPDAVWEDGQPVVAPDPAKEVRPNQPQPDPKGMVPLDTKALQKSFEALKKHWHRLRD